MKAIKISFLLALVTMAVTSVQAQVSFGVRAGVNFSNINGKDASDDKLENKILPGFNAGVNVEIPVADDFYVQPGLLFSTKGTKWDMNNNAKTNLGYLELPINFLYKADLGAGKMLLGVGPYLAYGITGKVTADGGYDEKVKYEKEVSSVDFAANGPIYHKPFDAGANVLVGYEFANKLSAQLNAGLGLVNTFPKVTGVGSGSVDNINFKNTTFGVSIGYRF
jgi:hypothetical protein